LTAPARAPASLLPARPRVDETERGAAELRPRYEDITQDGRVALTALMPGLGATGWSAIERTHKSALGYFRREGILPILRRLVLVGGDGPFSVHAPLAFDGCFRLARERGGDRLFLNMWMDADAPVATTFGPPPAPDAPRALAGRAFAEHVITRPFAPPAERKVTRLDAPGFELREGEQHEHTFEPAESLLSSSGSGSGSGSASPPALEDAGDILFGMMHTDSNQHVNSLVYPRLFEEALVRRVANPALLARAVELRWRKPFFAGDRARLRLAMLDDRTAVGTFTPASSTDGRPSCVVRMTLG
jgi:hypothetical protein